MTNTPTTHQSLARSEYNADLDRYEVRRSDGTLAGWYDTENSSEAEAYAEYLNDIHLVDHE